MQDDTSPGQLSPLSAGAVHKPVQSFVTQERAITDLNKLPVGRSRIAAFKGKVVDG